MHLQDKEKVLKYYSIVKFSFYFLSLNLVLSKKKMIHTLCEIAMPVYTFTRKESRQKLIS